MILGEKHLNHVVSEFLAYYHEERPHQGIGNAPISQLPDGNEDAGEIVRNERLGGSLNALQPAGGVNSLKIGFTILPLCSSFGLSLSNSTKRRPIFAHPVSESFPPGRILFG